MRKVFALLSIAAVFAFASCEDKKAPESTVDTTASVTVPVDTTTPAVVDTTVAVDTTAKH